MGALHTLSNGLRVYADPMPSLETVAIGVWAHAGSADEREEEHGLAHLLEHMAFKGTETRSARMIAEEIESVGGYLNAATSHQRTGYYARLLKDDLGLGLDILSDIVLHPAFDESEFKKEIDVVIQEIGEAADTPDDVVFDKLQEIAWGTHPLARPILGTRQSVRAQTTAALRRFMTRCYQPHELVVAAAGKIDPDDFVKQVEDCFGALEASVEPRAQNKPAFCAGARHDDRAIEQTHLAVAFPGASARDADVYASRLFAEALGGGMASRLFQRIREEEGLAYSVYAFSDNYEDCGLVGAYAGADADEVASIAKAFREEVEAMAAETSQAELDRARAMLRASLMMSFESPAARIESAAGQLFRDGTVLTPAEIAERLDAVGVDDIRRCAAQALSGPVAISMVGPGDLGEAVGAVSEKAA